MNTQSMSRSTPSLLRGAFGLDAIATGGLGLVLALAAEQLHPWLEIPVMLLRCAGLACVVFAAWLAMTLMLQRLTRRTVMFAIAVNLAWVLASFVLLAGGLVDPTALGVAFVIAQAGAVAVFAWLEYLGMKRAF